MDKKRTPNYSTARLNFEKSELKPSQKIDFLGYHFDLGLGKVFPTEKKLKILEKSIKDIEVSSQTTTRLLMSLIGVIVSLIKILPVGQFTYASPSVAISQIIKSEDSGFKPSDKVSSVVERSNKCENRLSFTARRAQYPYFHRCIKPGLGSPFRKH